MNKYLTYGGWAVVTVVAAARQPQTTWDWIVLGAVCAGALFGAWRAVDSTPPGQEPPTPAVPVVVVPPIVP